MYPFIETIRIEDGQIYNLDYHTEPVSYTHLDVYKRQGLANLMVSPNNFELFRTRRGYALDQFGFPVDSLLPLRMAQLPLEKFRE